MGLEQWQACAGPMTSLSKNGCVVVYLPQGHFELLGGGGAAFRRGSLPLSFRRCYWHLNLYESIYYDSESYGRRRYLCIVYTKLAAITECLYR